MTDPTINYKMIYYYSYYIFQNNIGLTDKPSTDLEKIIINNINRILGEYPITIRGIKRFAKQISIIYNKKIILNPDSTNKKSIFMYYLLFVVGLTEINSFQDLNTELRKKFKVDIDRLYVGSYHNLNNEMISTEGYSDIIKKGAGIVGKWEYE